MTWHRITARGMPYVMRSDPGRVRNTGARFVRPEGEMRARWFVPAALAAIIIFTSIWSMLP